MLQIQVLSLPGRGLRLPTRIKSLRIDPTAHSDRVIQIDSERQGIINQSINLSFNRSDNQLTN